MRLTFPPRVMRIGLLLALLVAAPPATAQSKGHERRAKRCSSSARANHPAQHARRACHHRSRTLTAADAVLRLRKTRRTRPTIVNPVLPAPSTTPALAPAPVTTTAAALPPTQPAQSPAPAPVPVALPPSNAPTYWGAWIGSHLTGTEAPWSVPAITAFEQHAGKGASIINFSSPFANCSSQPCTSYAFPANEFNTIRSHGSIPFFSWASDALPVNGDQSAYQLADVIAGAHDQYIRDWATAAKAWGKPFFLRFNWEMNGNWFPWSEGKNGNQPGEYVAAWRHVHDLFTAVGATNATWTWCPNVDPGNVMKPLAGQYPGDAYVDWTCLDGYNWNTPRMSFSSLFKPTYDEITTQIAPGKPLIVGETGSTEAGGSKAAWISDMFASLPTQFQQLRGLLWFDKFDDGQDWPIESSPAATAAFAAGIAAPRYTSNQFSALSGGAIAPMS